MSWPKEKYELLLKIVQDIKSQINDVPYEDMNSRSWGFEEGVLISGAEAELLLEALENVASQLINKL